MLRVMFGVGCVGYASVWLIKGSNYWYFPFSDLCLGWACSFLMFFVKSHVGGLKKGAILFLLSRQRSAVLFRHVT